MKNESIYYKMDEHDKEVYENVQKMTCTDYEELGDFIPVENLWAIIEDLKYEYDKLQEEFEDYKEYIKEINN